jgi:Rad3-related DNA helicase
LDLTNDVDRLFGRGGPLSCALPDYEWRPEQADMARAVARTLAAGGVLAVEAPTGVGKTLAYLVPAALAARSGRRILLASTTKNLQEQIVRQDVPLSRRVLGEEFPVAVVKGRASYACARRFALFAEQADDSARTRRFVKRVRAWIARTGTGELEEFEAEGGPVPRDLWARIASDGAFCASRECARSGCFYRESRRRARASGIIIANHALLFSEIFGGGAGLPEFDAAILDEAHNVERIATDHLGIRFGPRAVRELVERGPGLREGEGGAFEEVRRWARSHLPRVGRLALTRALREAAAAERDVFLRAEEFLAGVARHVAPGDAARRRYRRHEAESDLFAFGLDDLSSALGRAAAGARGAFDAFASETAVLDEEDTAEARLALAANVSACEKLRNDLDFLTGARETGYVYWVEREESLGALVGAPLHVGAALRAALLGRVSSLVLTSATLATDEGFGFILERLGLDAEKPDTLCLPSPFDLPAQVLAIGRSSPPGPDDPGYAEHTAAALAAIASGTRRKVLALFTSHEALRRTRRALEDLGPAAEVLAQGVDGGRAGVTEAFKRDGPAVLLGAASFWEGVDFPGELLEVLVVTRLPFPVPTDPLTEARAERCQEEGGDSFRDFTLPEAVLRFRQGFGRLVRRRTDRGVFLVLDPRLLRASYGALFRRSVGLEFVATRSDPGDLAGMIAGWFARTPPGAAAP